MNCSLIRWFCYRFLKNLSSLILKCSLERTLIRVYLQYLSRLIQSVHTVLVEKGWLLIVSGAARTLIFSFGGSWESCYLIAAVAICTGFIQSKFAFLKAISIWKCFMSSGFDFLLVIGRTILLAGWNQC